MRWPSVTLALAALLLLSAVGVGFAYTLSTHSGSQIGQEYQTFDIIDGSGDAVGTEALISRLSTSSVTAGVPFTISESGISMLCLDSEDLGSTHLMMSVEFQGFDGSLEDSLVTVSVGSADYHGCIGATGQCGLKIVLTPHAASVSGFGSEVRETMVVSVTPQTSMVLPPQTVTVKITVVHSDS